MTDNVKSIVAARRVRTRTWLLRHAAAAGTALENTETPTPEQLAAFGQFVGQLARMEVER